jgi:hypothetical protein
MSSLNRWVVQDDTNGVSPTGFVGPADSSLMFRKLSDHTGRAAGGACASKLSLAFNPVAAQATVTATGVGTNGDTLTIGNVVITIVTSGATGNQVNIAASAAALATSIVNLINTSSSFTGIVTATNPSSGVIQLFAAIPGTIGNGIGLAKSSTALTLTHLWGSVVAGSEGTAAVFSLGL